MGFNEFKELWTALKDLKSKFIAHDKDKSGTVDPAELHSAIVSEGYQLSPQALNILVKRYAHDGEISFDDFVGLAEKLKIVTNHFKHRDTTKSGKATFNYD